MSTFTTNTASTPVFGGVFSSVSGLIETALQYRLYRQTITELNKLSAKDLEDLGLNRGTIKAVAMEAVYGA
jgi:uncharacterized protein YjiS (DUF1127 family)